MTHPSEKRYERHEVPEMMTWDLTALFPNREAWLSQLTETAHAFDALVTYKNRLCRSAETLYECLSKFEKAYIQMVQLGTYANLKQSEDATNPQNQEDSLRFGAMSTAAQTKVSFMSSEITALDPSDYHALFESMPDLNTYKNYLDDIYKVREHMLSAETEAAIASLGEVTSSPYRTYQVSKGADMPFDDFKLDNGTLLPNSFALFESKYEFSPDAEVRQKSYQSFSKSLNQYKNTFASVYATEVKKQVALSRLRNYSSVTEMLLESHKVSEEMYHLQIDTVFKGLAPHMRAFAKLKQSTLGLDKMHFYDLKAPLDHEFNPPATYDAIKTVIINALGILGEDYQKIMHRAFDERWIDYADNVGKSTGAFCASPYGAHSYILISYQDSMRSAFTLAHELGHAGHFTLANAAQRIFDTRPSTYFVEAPSTINEILLAEHLMKLDKQPRMRRWVILQLLGTYYHNFVTHLLEAEFQRRVYAHAEKGGALTAKSLTEMKLAVLREFWADSVEIDEDAGLTWMRQPHYYMGLYPYTYSAGLTASTAIAGQIIEEGQPAVDRWLNTLRAGGTLPPQALLKLAGLDMTTVAPVESAVAYVGKLISELEILFK